MICPRSFRDRGRALFVIAYSWFTFPHSYSAELVAELLREWELGPNNLVLDPFVGAGTTLVACQDADIPSIGIDLSHWPLSRRE